MNVIGVRCLLQLQGEEEEEGEDEEKERAKSSRARSFLIFLTSLLPPWTNGMVVHLKSLLFVLSTYTFHCSLVVLVYASGMHPFSNVQISFFIDTCRT